MNSTQEVVECHECGTRKFKSRMYAMDVHDSPWDAAPKTIYVCKHTPKSLQKHYHREWMESCEELLTDTGWADFRYFTCASCHRMVISQCPSNGWHSYVHTTDDGDEICLKCYEADLYENGIPRESFENNKIGGMFFNRGDLQKYGYAEVEGYQNFFVRGTEDAKRFCKEAIKWIDAGYKVAVDYDHMSIGMLEGYVNMFIKPEKVDPAIEKLVESFATIKSM